MLNVNIKSEEILKILKNHQRLPPLVQTYPNRPKQLAKYLVRLSLEVKLKIEETSTKVTNRHRHLMKAKPVQASMSILSLLQLVRQLPSICF
jgi:hypothetical protein